MTLHWAEPGISIIDFKTPITPDGLEHLDLLILLQMAVLNGGFEKKIIAINIKSLPVVS